MPRRVDPGTIRVGTGLASNNSIDSNSFTAPVVNSQTIGLNAHVNDPRDAHPASAISVDDPSFDGKNMGQVLDEIAALVPPRPPTVGNFTTLLSYSGIPDWGLLKLDDAGMADSATITSPDPSSPNPDIRIYPYFHLVPEVADDSPPFDPFLGDDPQTDPTFNVFDGVYTGGGDGTAHTGGFTRPSGGPPNPIKQTARLVPSEGLGVKSFIVSGPVYPADRGVLALFFWGAGINTPADFILQPLGDRVLAAILLGQGLNAEDNPVCDGEPGGIFTTSTADPVDPFTYPGQATGQYDLVELHTGLVGGVGAPLPPPFSPGNPSAGQVRLGTDPNAGPVIAGGIPILGATTAATGGGNDNNFFRYRLPYLDDYLDTTGLKYTPTAEKSRYFTKPSISLNPGTDLTQAGDYANFAKDYWAFQVARYRHRGSFPTGLPNPPNPRDVGSYVLVHFKTERDFELYARDGVMPGDSSQCYEVYSAEMANWDDPEDPINLSDSAASPPETASGYHVLRALNYEDPEALDPLTIPASNEFDYIRTVDEVVTVSGVSYFVPGAGGSEWRINDFVGRATGYFENSYRMSQESIGGEVAAGLEGPDPYLIYLGTFSFESGRISHAGVADFDGTVQQERIEFGYNDLDQTSGHGPWTLVNGPEPGDEAAVTLTPGDPSVIFLGDDSSPRFSQDARVRAFFRSPIGFESPTTAMLPAQGYLVPPADGRTILFHSTSANPSGGAGSYGNYNSAGVPSPARAGLETILKDTEERFLDEVYRWGNTLLGTTDPSWDGSKGQIAGPGLPFGASAILSFPVRAGSAAAPWDAASWLQQGIYDNDLNGLTPPEAQVAGLPDRNPPLSDGVVGAAPSAGIVMYPKIDYSNAAVYRPSAPGDLTVLSQPNYTTITTPEVMYVRSFDAAFSRSATPVSADGQPFFILRVRGLRLQDFQYAAPGPGSAEIAIEVKVPGLTTWMDAGRVDGSGPSKQDAYTDGAGCKLTDPLTTDARDAETGVWHSDVRVNVGPAVNLYKNPTTGEVPVLVRVRIKQAGATFDFTQGGADATTDNLRGVIGLEIVRP